MRKSEKVKNTVYMPPTHAADDEPPNTASPRCRNECKLYEIFAYDTKNKYTTKIFPMGSFIS